MESRASTPDDTGAGAAPKGRARIEEPSRAERSIARRSAETRATVPDLEMSIDVDAGPLLRAAEHEGVATTAVLVGACAAALTRCPRANAAYRDGRFELYSRVNVGLTFERPDATVHATILDADVKPLARLDAELARLRARALAGELTPPEQAGSTFTLSDLGGYGVHRAAALIMPPQAAALTAGAVRPAPVVRAGAVTAGHLLTLTLVCDHRILFGAQAAGFLSAVAAHLEQADERRP